MFRRTLLTGAAALAAAAPGHIKAVREHLLNRLTEEQLHQLAAIGEAILADQPAAINVDPGL